MFTGQEEPGGIKPSGVKPKCRKIGRRTDFMCIFISTDVKVITTVLDYANKPDTLISIGECIVRVRFFAFNIFKSEAYSACAVGICFNCQK